MCQRFINNKKLKWIFITRKYFYLWYGTIVSPIMNIFISRPSHEASERREVQVTKSNLWV